MPRDEPLEQQLEPGDQGVYKILAFGQKGLVVTIEDGGRCFWRWLHPPSDSCGLRATADGDIVEDLRYRVLERDIIKGIIVLEISWGDELRKVMRWLDEYEFDPGEELVPDEDSQVGCGQVATPVMVTSSSSPALGFTFAEMQAFADHVQAHEQSVMPEPHAGVDEDEVDEDEVDEDEVDEDSKFDDERPCPWSKRICRRPQPPTVPPPEHLRMKQQQRPNGTMPGTGRPAWRPGPAAEDPGAPNMNDGWPWRADDPWSDADPYTRNDGALAHEQADQSTMERYGWFR